METLEKFESNINKSDYKILIVDDVVSNVLLLKILLSNEKFLSKAPAEKIAEEKEKQQKYQQTYDQITERLKQLSK